MEIIIILLLIVLNGVLAMSEIAIVSARRSKLQQQANEGNEHAQAALDLSLTPNRFLSTVQIGITFIGIFAGAFGGETIAQKLTPIIATIPPIEPYSELISILIVVSIITYLSLVIGELVPKRLALIKPETVAKAVAKPMNTLSTIASPLVSLLTFSSDWILKLIDVKPSSESNITEEEVKLLMKEGTSAGVFDLAEKDIVERTLRLGDKKISTMMTPRKEIIFLDIDETFEEHRNVIASLPHSYFPVCRDGLDDVLGIIQTKDLLSTFLIEEKIDLTQSLHKPIFIPETMEPLDVLELFKKSGIHIALIVDEFGSTLGLISLTDILEEIVGDIPTANEAEEQEITKRDDGTYLVDGLLDIEDFKRYFKIRKLPGESHANYHTVGGLVMSKIGRIPVSGDRFELGDWSFEVVDMDDNRVDKIMISQKV